MNLLDEIREYFASTQKGARLLKSLPNDYKAFVIRTDDGYGVAIPYKNESAVSEKFANARLYSARLVVEENEEFFLILSCSLDSLRYEFATLCAEFAEPGENGLGRKNLIEDPLEWWMQWRMLLGNAMTEKTSYSVIAEMLVLEKLYSQKKRVEWSAVHGGSHDIESEDGSYEVKSTVKRYDSTITIAGQHQLKSVKRLQIYFCRLEKSKQGISINDMKERLISLGYCDEKLEQQLSNLGFEYGASARHERYKVLETRKYEVDNTFPKITQSSFKDEKIPQAIIQITYTVDLDGLKYTQW